MERNYPAAAADLLATGSLPPVLFNHYGAGSYLIYRLYPAMGVFQDGRLQAYPRSFASRLHAGFSMEDLPVIFREYGVNTALVQRHHVKLFDLRAWALVFWDDRWAVLTRKSRVGTDLLDDLEYRVFLPETDVDAERDRDALVRLAAEMERNQRARRTRSHVLDNNLGTVYRRLGRGGEAQEALRRALGAAPDYAPAWANLGALYLDSGKRELAAESLAKALALDPSLAGAAALLERARPGGVSP
jgi:tetratricopeptide (TPR) repeat protein